MNEQKEQTQAIPVTQRKEVDNVGFVSSLLNAIRRQWMTLKDRLGFDTLSSEYSKYMELKDRFTRNKEKVSVDDVMLQGLLGEIDALKSRLEEFENLSTEEVRAYKQSETPFTIMGKKIELNGYKNIATYAMYGLAIFVGYKYLLRPYIFPAVGKLLTTKVKVKKGGGFSDMRDADFRII